MPTPTEIRAWLAEHAPDAVLWADCDAALIGVGVRCGFPTVAVYDPGKLVQVFIDQGLTAEDATEWVDVNILGAYVGETTPIVLISLDTA